LADRPADSDRPPAERPRVFLTGATGFIGGHVLRALRAAGYRVRVLVRDPDAAARVPDAETVPGDLRRPGDFLRAMEGCRYLVHCAALYSFAPRDRPAMRTVNAAGTGGLLEAARIAGIERAVVTSSAGTVGEASLPGGHRRPGVELGPDEHAATEVDGAAGAHSAYHRSKIEQERAALAARVPAVLVLPTATVGPGDWKPTPTGQLVLDFARGRIFAAPPGGGLNMVAVEDVARAHVLALERGRPRERYLIGGENLGFDAVWQLLAEVTGRPAPRWRVPVRLALLAGAADELRCRLRPAAIPHVPLEGVRMSVERMYVDSAKARAELGWEPGPVRDALGRAVAWYREHGYFTTTRPLH
jgi:dihydroflavonol-4-reductase